MNICVCVKQVEETYARTGKDPDHYFLNPEDRIFRINPYDEAAMELALQAKAHLQGARIIVIVLGPMLAQAQVWRLMGMGGEQGADQLCQIELVESEEPRAPMDSWCKAVLLAQAVQALGGDLVLCGKESIDRQNGLVGAYLARQLKRPFVSGIMALSLEPKGASARITQNAGKGRREILDCNLPAVFSVDLFSAVPAMPAYESIQRARRQSVTRMVLDPQTIAPRIDCLATSAPRPRTKPVDAPDSRMASFERIQMLLAGSRIEKKGKTILGSPASQVQEIVDFLEYHGLVPTAPKPAARP